MTKRNEFTEEQKKKILDRDFGDKKTIKDIAGRKISRESAEVDHKYPASRGGTASLKNGMAIHPLTNKEKTNNLSGPIGPKSNEKFFKVTNKKQPKIIVKKNAKK